MLLCCNGEKGERVRAVPFFVVFTTSLAYLRALFISLRFLRIYYWRLGTPAAILDSAFSFARRVEKRKNMNISLGECGMF